MKVLEIISFLLRIAEEEGNLDVCLGGSLDYDLEGEYVAVLDEFRKPKTVVEITLKKA